VRSDIREPVPVTLAAIEPDWPAPVRVRAMVTTRAGGVSVGSYASLNLGTHVGDDPGAVAENRARLRACLPSEPRWIDQVHGTDVVDAGGTGRPTCADASFTHASGIVCVVLTADCLPVLLCDRAGTFVGAAHAGWRGLCAGVLESTVRASGIDPARLLAWLGPAIGPQRFEVGAEVRAQFCARAAEAASAFVPGAPGKFFGDLYALARQRLQAIGVAEVHGGGLCTVTDAERFFSHRRDRVSGRMASLIWMTDD